MPIATTTAMPVCLALCGPLTTAHSRQATPVARVVLERGRHSWIWIVPACPYCGKQHDHYAGPLDSDPYSYAGRMLVARCDNLDRKRVSPTACTGDLRYVLEPDPGEEGICCPVEHSTLGRLSNIPRSW